MRDLIENKGNHKYLRRIPWPGRKKKYRYVYDARIATQLPVQPSPGEKVRVPHGEQPGHYEILRVLKLGTVVVADLQHDETGYRMFVPVENLHKLVKEALTAPPEPKIEIDGEQVSLAAAAAKLRAEYRKADALPKARWRALDMILDSSGVQDYGLRKRDQQYLAWQRGTDKKPAPLPGKDGSLDGFDVRGERKTRFCCLREAFNHATANAKTWRDLIPVVEKLRTVPDLEGVNLPAEVLSRHADEDSTLHGVEAGLVAPKVDYTRYGVPFDGGIPEDDLLFLAITHDPEAAAQAGEFEEPDEPEEDPWMNPFDTPADAQAWLNARAVIGKHRLHAAAARQQARYDPEAREVAEYHDAEAERLEAELEAAGHTPVRGARYRKNPDGSQPENVTQTEAFRRWFGDSKVVDGQGKPLSVYHGTDKGGFYAFDMSESEKHRKNMMFFTSDYGMARTYTRERGDPTPPYFKSVEDFLQYIKNEGDDAPWTIETEYYVVSDEDETRYRYLDDLHEAWEDVADDDIGVVYRVFDPDGYKMGLFDSQNPKDMADLLSDVNRATIKKKGVYEVYLRIVDPYEVDAKGANWDEIPIEEEDEDGNPVTMTFTTNELANMARDMGCDGLIIRDVYDSGRYGQGGESGDVFVVFDDKQIKSVNNIGTFDPTTDDIRRNASSRRGLDALGFDGPRENPRRRAPRPSAPYHPSADPWLVQRALIGKHRLHAAAARQQARYDPEAREVAEYHDAEAERLEAELAERFRKNPYDPEDDPLSDVYVIDTETLEDGTVVKYVESPFPYERKPLAHNDDPKVQAPVNLAHLIGTQRRVTVAGVEKYLAGIDEKPPRPGSARMPAILVYETSDGRQYIADGHHRAFAALLRDMETFPAIIQFVRE